MNSGTLRTWYQASRAKFFIATLIPLSLGGVIASQNDSWDTGLWLVILLASFLVHLNTNLANDYFEYFSGADEGDSIGGSRVLQEGKITLRQMRKVMIIFYLVALLCGLWIISVTKLWWLIPVMLLAFFSSLFYTAPPIRYGYRGLGELLVSINMGPIMTAGTASAMMGAFSPKAFYLSLPIAFMVAFILYYQSLSDIDDDRAVGKNTLAVHLGQSRIIYMFRTFIIMTLLSVVFLVIFKLVHPLCLFSILTAAILIKTDKLIKNVINLQDLHERGGPVRMFYLVNGMILITGIIIT